MQLRQIDNRPDPIARMQSVESSSIRGSNPEFSAGDDLPLFKVAMQSLEEGLNRATSFAVSAFSKTGTIAVGAAALATKAAFFTPSFSASADEPAPPENDMSPEPMVSAEPSLEASLGYLTPSATPSMGTPYGHGHSLA